MTPTTINISIEGYKATTLNFKHVYNNVAIYDGYATKQNGKKPFHTTVQFRLDNSVRVMTIENLKNVHHVNYTFSK